MPTMAHDRPVATEASRAERFRSGYLRIAPRLLAALSALLGLLTLIDAVVRSERLRVHDLTQVIPVPASAAASAVVAVSGLILLRVAAGLRKRKRRAWRIAVGVTAVTIVAHIVKAHRIGESVVSVLFLILLITARSQFKAKADPRLALARRPRLLPVRRRRDRVRHGDALRQPTPHRRQPVVR